MDDLTEQYTFAVDVTHQRTEDTLLRQPLITGEGEEKKKARWNAKRIVKKRSWRIIHAITKRHETQTSIINISTHLSESVRRGVQRETKEKIPPRGKQKIVFQRTILVYAREGLDEKGRQLQKRNECRQARPVCARACWQAINWFISRNGEHMYVNQSLRRQKKTHAWKEK